jgi:hypothetical protein
MSLVGLSQELKMVDKDTIDCDNEVLIIPVPLPPFAAPRE